MFDAKLEAAAQLIEEQQYITARAILLTMPNSAVAKQLLARLDELEAKLLNSLAPKSHFAESPNPHSSLKSLVQNQSDSDAEDFRRLMLEEQRKQDEQDWRTYKEDIEPWENDD